MPVCGTANPSLVSNWVFAFLQHSTTGLSVVVSSYEYYTKRDRHDNILASICLWFQARPNGPRVDEREQCQVIVLEVPQPMPDRPSLVHDSLEHRTWSNASAKASTTALPGAGEGCSPAWFNAPVSTTTASILRFQHRPSNPSDSSRLLSQRQRALRKLSLPTMDRDIILLFTRALTIVSSILAAPFSSKRAAILRHPSRPLVHEYAEAAFLCFGRVDAPVALLPPE